MSRIFNYSEYKGFIFESYDISFFRKYPIFRRALTDRLIIDITDPILELLNADKENIKQWIPPYRKIFQKSCIKFGGGRNPDINSTCDKGKALMGLVKHILDPKSGLIRENDIEKWAQSLLKDSDPEKKPKRWSVSSEEIDDTVMKYVDLLERTKVKPSEIKEIGTFILEIALPIMSRFFKKTDLKKMKMITSNKLITPSVGLKLIESPNREEDVDSGEIQIY
jgi:hypothetical protein